MNKTLWQRFQPHVIAIAIFFAVSCIYCLPVFKGMVLNQYDVMNWKGMAQQSLEFKEKHGHLPLWSNSLFSGMPAYQIDLESKYNVTIAYLHHVFTLFLPEPAGLFFLACIGFYILCMAMGARSWIGILGSLSYAFASYSAVIVVVGHTTKFSSMGYAPAVLAGLVLLTQRKYVLGFMAMVLFTTLLVWQNHLQIVYYTFLTAGLLAIAYAVHAIVKKEIKPLLVTAGLAAVAVALGVASYAVVLLPTREYAKETMRGGRSQLTIGNSKDNKSNGGLDRDYAFEYSYGMAETFSLITPRIFGGSNPTVVNNEYVSELGSNTKTAEVMEEKTGMSEDQANDFVKQLPAYWGSLPFTSGTVYIGAVVCFLFILGLVYYRGWHLGWIIAATLLGIVLSWGKNFGALNYFLLDYLPFYNKFRAPSMGLVIPQLTMPLLGVLGLNVVFSGTLDKNLLWKKFRQALFITAGLFAVLGVLYFSLDYRGPNDQAIRENLTNGMQQQMARGQQPPPEIQQQAAEFGRTIVNALTEDRRSIFGADLLRSLLFILLAAGVTGLFIKKKLTAQIALIALAALGLIDLIGVDVRYLGYKNYQPKEESTEFTPNRADLQIKQDTGYFRVYNEAAGNMLTDSRTSYFHNSVGGYHPARLALYDDLIKYQLNKGNMQVFNMLNTKYIITTDPTDRQPVAQQNPGALGPCWLVKTIKYVNSADEEMKALDTFNPKDTAIVNKEEQSKIPFQPQFDSAATIRLVQNLHDKITYDFNAATNQFAVLSEVYYPHGWKAFIDGKETPIVRVNYLLRGLAVPAGKHTIELRFEPQSFIVGDQVSLVTGILSILILIGGFFYLWKTNRSGFINTTKQG